MRKRAIENKGSSPSAVSERNRAVRRTSADADFNLCYQQLVTNRGISTIFWIVNGLRALICVARPTTRSGVPDARRCCAWWGGNYAATGAEGPLLEKDVERFGASDNIRLDPGSSGLADNNPENFFTKSGPPFPLFCEFSGIDFSVFVNPADSFSEVLCVSAPPW